MSGQLWGTNTLGGFLYSDEQSDMLRAEVVQTARFRNLCDAGDFNDKGLHRGQIASWAVVSQVATDGTRLDEKTEMPQTNVTVRNGTATVHEYGNGVPFTSLLDMYSQHHVASVVKKQLSVDCRRTLDKEAHDEFNRCLLRYVGTATGGGVLTTNGTATATNNSALNRYHVREIATTMRERNIPGYREDDYGAIANPSVLSDMRADLESVNQYVETGYAKITAGEVGRFEGVRFLEQTNVQKGVSNDGSAWSNSASDWCFFFGNDTVFEVIVVAPEVRAKIPGDYGRNLGCAWYALEGFGIVYDSTTDPSATNSRIIKWDSAA